LTSPSDGSSRFVERHRRRCRVGYTAAAKCLADDFDALVVHLRYVTSSDFWVDVLENWQSEYLQFTLFILATVAAERGGVLVIDGARRSASWSAQLRMSSARSTDSVASERRS